MCCKTEKKFVQLNSEESKRTYRVTFRCNSDTDVIEALENLSAFVEIISEEVEV